MGVWLYNHKIWLTYNLVTISQQKNNENGWGTAEFETPLKAIGKTGNNQVQLYKHRAGITFSLDVN